MNTLNLYYSYIKSPYGICNIKRELNLIYHPPVFVLTIHDCILTQTAEYVRLFFFIPRYYFIMHKIIPTREYAYTEVGARAPPSLYIEKEA